MKVKELAQSAIGDSADVDVLLACKWVSDCFVELATLIRAVPFRKSLQFVFPQNITAGTISITNGTNKVTGDATAKAAWSPSLVGRFIRVDSDTGWYQIVNTGAELTLQTTFAGTTVASGGYTIAPRIVTLDKSVRSIIRFTNSNIGQPLTRISQDEMDFRFPNRIDVAGGPTIYSEVALDDEGRHLIEFYPYSSEDVLINYIAYIDPKPLSPEQEIPAFIPNYIISEGVKLRILEHLTGQALRGNGDANTIAVLGNLKARQGTIWKDAKTDFKNVSGIDEESKVTVQSYGSILRPTRDVTNAHEHVLAGWTPLI